MKKIFLIVSLLLFGVLAFAEGRIISDNMNNGTRIVKYQPDEMICASMFEIHLKGNVVTLYKPFGGCSGNGRGIGALVKGMTVDQAISRLEGIPCGNRPTSCPDQLAQALKAIKAKDAKK